MEKEELKCYERARSVSDSTIIFAKKIVKEGSNILEIAEKIEEKIRRLNAEPAFPVNISINENAAHYTPDISDTTKLKAQDMVKIDIGVKVDGYIWDRAFTVCIGEKNHPLIQASEKALEETLRVIKAGVKVFEYQRLLKILLKNLDLILFTICVVMA